MTTSNIRDFEQAVYVYWLGDNATVKIGHTNDPARRLNDFRRETGTPGHKAQFAAIVWLDRNRERVEAEAHRAAAAYRRNGEWFALSPSVAIDVIVAAAQRVGATYEVEDCAGLWQQTLDRRAAEVAEATRLHNEAALSQSNAAIARARAEESANLLRIRAAELQAEEAKVKQAELAIAEATANASWRAAENARMATDAALIEAQKSARTNTTKDLIKVCFAITAIAIAVGVTRDFMPKTLADERAKVAALETEVADLQTQITRANIFLVDAKTSTQARYAAEANVSKLGGELETCKKDKAAAVALAQAANARELKARAAIDATPKKVSSNGTYVEEARLKVAKAHEVCRQVEGFYHTMPDTCVNATAGQAYMKAKADLVTALSRAN